MIAIDGKPIKAGEDYNAFLGRRLNRKVELTVNNKPVPEGAWKVKYEPLSMMAFNNLRYDRWVKERRATAGQAFWGRVGYLHIKAMDQPSLDKVRRKISANSVIKRGWSSTSGLTAAAISSKSCWRSWFVPPLRGFGSCAAASSQRMPSCSQAILARRSYSKTGEAPQTPRCFRPGSGPLGSAR